MHELSTEQRTRYLRTLLQRYGTLSLPLGSGLSFALLQVFQPLRLRQSVAREKQQPKVQKSEQDEPLDAEKKGEAGEPAEPLEVLAENGIEALNKSPRGRLVILGGPGSGKTTVLKHLLCAHAHRALEEQDAPLPIFLSLPDLARAEQDLNAYLVHLAHDMGLDADTGSFLSHALQRGQAFLCLDSLDEVLPRLRAGIIHQINELALQQNGNIWIIGSRFTDYKGGQFRQGQFQEWELQMLDEPRRVRLAEQLLPELQRQISTQAQPASNLTARQYIDALREHPQAASWGQNPLLFSLAAVVYLRRGTLSGSRAMLYREVIAALLETREPDEQQRADLYHLLAEIALELYQIKGRTFSLDDVHTALTNLNRERQATWSVEEMLYRILNSGLFDVITAETYSFRHQTFQEYLVASALAWRFISDDKQISGPAHDLAWGKHTYSRWNEIERLLVGILVQEYRQAGMRQAISWLTRLLRQQRSPEGDPGHLSLELALKVLGEVAELAEWQTEETLALEEEAATVWLNVATTFSTLRPTGAGTLHRLWMLAPEIGRLRASAQEKIIEPLFQARLRHPTYQSILNPGSLHSQVVADRLRSIWEAGPPRRNWLAPVFVALQEYAPVDLLLAPLETEQSGTLQPFIQALSSLKRHAPITRLLAHLSYPRAETRAAAATILRTVIEQADVPVEPLVELCQQQTVGVFEAARVLAYFRHPAALEPLLAGLEQTNTRKEALEALADLGPLVPPTHLLACLGDADSQIRFLAIRGLGKLGPSCPFERLLALRHELDAGEQMVVIEVLGDLACQGLPIPVSFFLEMLQSPLDEVVCGAVKAIGKMGKRAPVEELLPLLTHPAGWIVKAVLKVLGNPGIVERVPVETLLTFYTSHWVHRQETLATLANMAHRVPLAFLMQTLNTDNVVMQKRAARLLGQIAARRPVEQLLDQLGENVWAVRNAAVIILGLDSAEETLPSLLKAVGDEVPRVSHVAAGELGKIADRVPLPPLLELLHHPASWVRQAALTILARRSMHFQREPIIACLHDQDALVRMEAVNLFATWAEDAPLEELVNATHDEHEEVCLATASALGKIGWRDPALAQEGLLRVMRRPPFEEEEATEIIGRALAAVSPHAPTEPLMQAMNELFQQKNPWDAEKIARALATQEERIPVSVLRTALQNPDPHVRRSVLLALSGAGAAAPIDAIIEQLREPWPVRSAAIEALCALSPFVPEDLLVQLWNEVITESGYIHLYQDIFRAIKQQREQIPVEVLSQMLQKPRFFSYNTVEFVGSLDELQLLPAGTLLPILAMMRANDQRTPSPSLEMLYATWMPRFSLDTISEALQASQTDVRRGVLQLLAYRAEEIPQELLLSALKDAAPPVRVRAIERLRAHSAPLPVQILLERLADHDASVRQAAIAALGTLGGTAPLDALLSLLQESATGIRMATLTALSQPGLLERVSVEIFLEATGDAESSVRSAALQVLKRKDQAQALACACAALGNTMAQAYLPKTYQTPFEIVRELQPELLAEIRQEAMSILEGGQPGRFFQSIRMSFLADTIGNMGRATPELLARLGDLLDWPYWEVRMKATQALGKLRRNIPDAMIRQLLDLRHDPRSRAVREAADEALAEILSLETGIEDN